MAQYRTEQKKILLDFLRTNSGKSFTIEEIISALDGNIGKSTVYRLMTGLVEEKKVHKSAGEGRTFLYRITADEHCKHHLHLQCKDCGKVLHLDEATSDALLDSVRCARDFLVSEEDTVLMGRCSQCKEVSGK
jgi:Fe2+ or Zn2+ uptake regulation protein